MNLPKIVKSYLAKQKHFQWEIKLGENNLFNNIIVVPALKESKSVPLLIKSLEKNSKNYLDESLIIFVVNNGKNDRDEIKEDNKNLIRYLDDYNSIGKRKLNVGYLDASTYENAFEDKLSGVGFARKLGMDTALRFFNYNNQKKKILISLDADCIVTPNYLETIVEKFNQSKISSAVIGFEHTLPGNKEHRAAIINYEIFLRYYVLGLHYSNSHYAFHSLGSIISCDYESYVKVGGMNKRKAGEDFYFLEKLAKIGEISRIKEKLVYPSPRNSDRVPFGTGPRINRFLKNTKDEYKLYNPQSFDILKYWHETISDVNNLMDPDKIMKEVKTFHDGLEKFLLDQNFNNSWKNVLKNSKSIEQVERQIINWMDGFRTMKLVHFLRDKYYPDSDMFEAINILMDKANVSHSIKNQQKIPSLYVQEKYLNLLRKYA